MSNSEAFVVRAEQLSPVLIEWKRQYEGDRSEWERRSNDFNLKFRKGGGNVPPLGPFQWLSLEAGIHERKLWGIASCEYKLVMLSTADKILNALGKQYMLYNDEIEVFPNPHWSKEFFDNYMDRVMSDPMEEVA